MKSEIDSSSNIKCFTDGLINGIILNNNLAIIITYLPFKEAVLLLLHSTIAIIYFVRFMGGAL